MATAIRSASWQGFEITAAAARNPTTATTARVRQVREGAIDKVASDVAIDGIPAAGAIGIGV
eukprot:7387731-Prymnesium_polylepis.1